MPVLLLLIGGFLAFGGLFIVFMFTGSEALGLALVGVACFLGIVARVDQAGQDHKRLVEAIKTSSHLTEK